MDGHFFGSDYYAVYKTNSRKRVTSPWFCNRPLSPPPKSTQETEMETQNPNVTSSSDENNITNSAALSNDSDLLPVSQQFGDMQKDDIEMADEDSEDHDDSDKDPDYMPEDQSSVSEYDIEDNSHTEIINPESSSEGKVLDNKSEEESTAKGNPQYSTDILGEFKRNGEKRKGNKKKDFCMFCESYVLNFARHVLSHSYEKEVQKIKSLSPKNKTRKKLLDELRKKGNFLNSSCVQKAIRKPQSNEKVLPCTNCMGFFSSKQLWRHRKACMGKTDKAHQAKAQDFLLRHLNVDKQLKEQVFPKMRADEISLVAKSDMLICAFGARYLKSHKEKHFLNVTSRKMRELARLLIEIKKKKTSVTNLFSALQPENFELLVSSTKIVAQYDDQNECYGSASTALNLGYAIKQCCELAILLVLKRKEIHSTVSSAELEAGFKTLITLIESEWRFEISSQASSDLNVRKWNKITMVPLASDLRVMKEFLISQANTAITQLATNCEDRSAYMTILETVFCRVLLLNRRRPGELQRLPLHIYEQSEVNRHNYEEFADVVTPAERILLQRFKRVVIRGKRGRGVPVLFSCDVQEHISILLKYRDKFLSKNNIYLFGNPGTIQPVCGYKIISKYAKLSGAKNPQAITATKLRKHLATLTQVLNMSDNDLEQLCTFMGHTVNIHRGSYRLPDDIFQTAKVSKLLLLMEKGEAVQYKGKSLDEINVNLNVEDDMNDSGDDETEPISVDVGPVIDFPDPQPGPSRDVTVENSSSATPKRVSGNDGKTSKRILVAWTDAQKKVTLEFFARHIKRSQPPKKHECIALKEKYPTLLENKDWLKIKVFTQNQYRKRNQSKF